MAAASRLNPRMWYTGRHMRTRRITHVLLASLIGVFALIGVYPLPALAGGATLYLSPPSGTFTVGSTFTVSVYMNTGGQDVNAVEVDLRFPADRLQAVTKLDGPSIISIWATPPSFSNSQGIINLKGGVPSPGIKTNAGIVASLTFRVTGVGQAAIKFTGDSKVLLDDGQGTDVLSDTRGAIYNLELPPPEGPFVSTPTHPDPNRWYPERNPIFIWEKKSDVTSYSYVLNDRAIETPDDIPEGDHAKVQYSNMADGLWFFHIKARGPGGWGGVTHVQIKIDSTAPAQFPIEISPRPRTSSHQPIIYYKTTDNLSGVDHYELKIVRVDLGGAGNPLSPFFIESESPYRPPPLELGTYDLIVRAYDKAGNIQEARQKLRIVPFLYQVVGDKGISFSGIFVVSWPVLWALGLILLLLAILLLLYLYRRHQQHDERIRTGGVAAAAHPSLIRAQELLQKKQEEYKKV